jgi:hypothetical protein
VIRSTRGVHRSDVIDVGCWCAHCADVPSCRLTRGWTKSSAAVSAKTHLSEALSRRAWRNTEDANLERHTIETDPSTVAHRNEIGAQLSLSETTGPAKNANPEEGGSMPTMSSRGGRILDADSTYQTDARYACLATERQKHTDGAGIGCAEGTKRLAQAELFGRRDEPVKPEQLELVKP